MVRERRLSPFKTVSDVMSDNIVKVDSSKFKGNMIYKEGKVI